MLKFVRKILTNAVRESTMGETITQSKENERNETERSESETEREKGTCNHRNGYSFTTTECPSKWLNLELNHVDLVVLTYFGFSS